MSNFENNFNEQKNIILQIDNLKKTFKDNISGESLTIIDGLSMKVFEGSKNIIIGDIKYDNIIVENGNPVFVDVDSMGINDLKQDHICNVPKGLATKIINKEIATAVPVT